MRLNFAERHPFYLNPDGPPYPIIPVVMLGSGGRRAETFALVDSGADGCLFHARWLSKIGLELGRGRYEEIYGINADEPVGCYVHRISLIIGNKMTVRCDVAFSEDIGDDPEDQLIGRATVFDRLQFGFRQRHQSLFVGPEV